MSFSVNRAVPAKKIVVIGARLAGLVVGYELTQAGHASECREPGCHRHYDGMAGYFDLKASNIIRC